ncbi:MULTISPECIES: hypothetical protein [Bilophila]|jgi:hypothetical protein|uniref:hypothetical protein n=2 Tax=Desulfovibrionaceae TaxID=194924 RepID=UPI0018DB0869|nr:MULTISPECIES: hypothetical protein [Bilophila]MDR4028216.1 hypothetical protein [Bilophila sp.]MCB8570322.1 hypothetical protein [Bilophila wadsworthia]MCC2714341.1 hypothetical protein [Bilophila wadsworthia]MCG4632038.1 hypothetical protein [Bilophila wadsworthia]MDU4376596.1 hypothetical protein [Bilophila wadsworthia]
MSDFFLNKEVDAYGRQNGKRHPKHSSKGGPFTERRILPEQEYIKHEPEYRCKGKNNQKKKKVKDTFDDKLELGKFHSVFSEKIRL